MRKNKRLLIIFLIIISFLLFIFRFGFLIMFMIGGNERKRLPTKEELREIVMRHKMDTTMTVFSDSLKQKLKYESVYSSLHFEEGAKMWSHVNISLGDKLIDSNKLEEMTFRIANSLKIKTGFKCVDIVVSWTWHDKQSNNKTVYFRASTDSLLAPSGLRVP